MQSSRQAASLKFKEQKEMENQTKKKAEVMFTNEDSWFTDKIIRIEEDYFLLHENGGENGSYDNRDFKETCTLIDRTEARRLALEWGEDLDDVAEKLA